MSKHDDIQRTLEAEQQEVQSPLPDYSKVKLTGSARKYAFMRAIKKFGTDKGTDLAAVLTYFAVLSLAPATLAIFSILTLVLASNASAVQNMLDDVVQNAVPAGYQDLVKNLVETMTESASGGVVALIIGVATALWSASAYVKAYSRNMNNIYGVVEGRNFVAQIASMLLITLTVLVSVVVILVSLALNSTLIEGLFVPIADPLGLQDTVKFMTESFMPIWAWLKWPVVILVALIMIGVLNHFTPNVQKPKFRLISAGAIFAVIGLAVAALAMYIYLSYFAGYSSYGMIGAVMALLFVMWVFNIVLLIAAEIDVEMERARQLAAGIPAEAEIQLPPRSVNAAIKAEIKEEKLVQDGATLRRSMAGFNDDRIKEPKNTLDGEERSEKLAELEPHVHKPEVTKTQR